MELLGMLPGLHWLECHYPTVMTIMEYMNAMDLCKERTKSLFYYQQKCDLTIET